MVSILSWPPVSLSTRWPKNTKFSCSEELAGQVDCILRVFDCASACDATPSAAAIAVTANAVFIGILLRGENLSPSRDSFDRYTSELALADLGDEALALGY